MRRLRAWPVTTALVALTAAALVVPQLWPVLAGFVVGLLLVEWLTR